MLILRIILAWVKKLSELSNSENSRFKLKHWKIMFLWRIRSSCLRSSVKIVLLRSIAKFTGKHLCQRLFLKKVAGLPSLAKVFSCEFYEISKNTFFTEHLRVTTSEGFKENEIIEISVFSRMFSVLFKIWKYLFLILLATTFCRFC